MLYQLALQKPIHFCVVSTFNQTKGKGYTGNVWYSSENQNLTFSFLIKKDLESMTQLPILNMWVAQCIVQVLSNWQIRAKLKWPNDIIVNGKKVGGILIQTKIQQNKVKFTVVGIGLNIYETQFNNLQHASSLVLEKPSFNKPLEDCLMEMLYYLESSFIDFVPRNYDAIKEEYHKHLFKKDEVATYEFDGSIKNGILRSIDNDGNALIEIEGLGLKTFKHKEVKLNY